MFRMIKVTSAIHDNPENNRILLDPYDFSAVCPNKETGAIVVLKNGFTYKVLEPVEEIEDMCRKQMAPFVREEKGGLPWNDDR